MVTLDPEWEAVSPIFLFRPPHFPAKPKGHHTSTMRFLSRLSFLLSAGQALGIPRTFHDDSFGRAQDGPKLAQMSTPLRAVPRGLRTPLPFDEDIFDPTYVVSNPSRDCGRSIHTLKISSTWNEPLNFTLVERNHARPFEIRRRSRPPCRDHTGYFDLPRAGHTSPTSRPSEKQRYALDRSLRSEPRPPVLRRD